MVNDKRIVRCPVFVVVVTIDRHRVTGLIGTPLEIHASESLPGVGVETTNYDLDDTVILGLVRSRLRLNRWRRIAERREIND